MGTSRANPSAHALSSAETVSGAPSAAHTPGPWFLRRPARAPFPSAITLTPGEARGDLANVIGGLGAQHAEAEANARLIAAAPDMYEVLRETRRLVSQAALSGFVDEDHVRQLFVNNGAITRVLKAAEGTSLVPLKAGTTEPSALPREAQS